MSKNLQKAIPISFDFSMKILTAATEFEAISYK
ncbi:hypothetical protein V144x_43070 [Gimesia aquarii]|uniref:Uncharacterized protein n=1 Tax=Gimesia aquarii TaxID=2527964 RepID=A0A517W0N3_9PLAN|nr:hypothetical protein V144x_43070 [Gimesia aquarii]